jgi:hypothetical protein
MKCLRGYYLPALVCVIFAVSWSPTACANPIFSFTVAITLTGNDVCNGPCISRLNESFDFQWDAGSSTLNEVNVGTITETSVTASGPIQFDGFGGDNWFLDQFAYMGTTDGLPPAPGMPYGDEIDLFLVSYNEFVSVDTPPKLAVAMYSCDSALCLEDFAPGNHPICAYFCGSSGMVSQVFTETGEVNPPTAPEPSGLSMLATGLLAFLGCASLGKRRSQ